ncbi:MAG: hypothetical protein AAF611_04355 [Bacteroidota bacterium]
MGILEIILLILSAIFLLVLIAYIIRTVKENKRGWRAQPIGRDSILYQQKIKNEWKEIQIEGEMLVGDIHKIIYFKTEQDWAAYPEWAQNRTEIIQRIKIDYPPHSTEYLND